MLAQQLTACVSRQCHLEILASLDVEDVEAALRGCLLKLQFADACLRPARKGAPPRRAGQSSCQWQGRAPRIRVASASSASYVYLTLPTCVAQLVLLIC